MNRGMAMGIAVVVLVVGAFLFFVNPAPVAWLPPCWFHKLTGLHCPGCGTTRALHALAHGQVATAFGLNPFLLVVLPALGALLLWRREMLRKPWVAWTLAGLVMTFGVLRNVPVHPFTMLSP